MTDEKWMPVYDPEIYLGQPQKHPCCSEDPASECMRSIRAKVLQKIKQRAFHALPPGTRFYLYLALGKWSFDLEDWIGWAYDPELRSVEPWEKFEDLMTPRWNAAKDLYIFGQYVVREQIDGQKYTPVDGVTRISGEGCAAADIGAGMLRGSHHAQRC